MRDYKSEEFKQEVLEKRKEAYKSGERRCGLCKYCEEIWKEKTVGIFNKRKKKCLVGWQCHITGEFSTMRYFSNCNGCYTLDEEKIKNM